MKHLFITILLLLPLCRMLAQEREYVIVVHGGAGAMENLEDDKEKSTLYYAALDSALSIGNAILSAGGEGPEAVMAVVNYFENNPLFNAITQGEARPNMMLPSADTNQPDAAVGTGSMPMTMSPTTGMQNPMGSPSTLASLPTESQVGITGSSLQFLNGFLRTQIGRKVMVEFLIGTNTLVDRSGILVAVGTNYILINESESDDLLACDYYNIKFVRFYY